VRVRLTLLYTGLFAACGAIVVVISYGLLAANLPDPASAKPGQKTVQDAKKTGQRETTAQKNGTVPPDFAETCKKALSDPSAEVGLRSKCQAAYEEGLLEGAKSQRDATLDRLLRYSLITLAAVTLLAAAAGWIVAGRVLRPVHQITAAARDASEHHLATRVALTGPHDELRELADTFDAMLDRLQAAFEGQRRFIANAGHELRTPLTLMRATVDVVLAKPAPTHDELLAMGQDVRAAVDHAERLIEALLTLARTDRGLVGREPVDLATILEDAVDAASSLPGATQPVGTGRLHTSLTPAPTTGDPILLERLAANLYDNAVRYNVPGGDVWLSTAMIDGRAVLTVGNTGPVIAPEAVAGLFEPFRRLRDRTGDGGFGLGLAIVASIATAHDGEAAAGALPDGGLRVMVSLPGRLGPLG
jgi:signal transduction histidine kinase